MNKNLYRVLFLLDDTQNYTNNFYIAEFSKIVLFQSGSIALSVDDLVMKIQELTDLIYTEEEVIAAIEQWNNGWLERKNSMYSLSSAGMEYMIHRVKENDISTYVDLFLHEHYSGVEFNSEECKSLVERFIFLRFNENLQQIADIFNHNLSYDDSEVNFDEIQSQFINDFLNWDHPEKNRCVYSLIAKAYDYCMINSRCSDSTLDFSKFHFYLDTNIIFRMLGLNGKIRQNAINNLIDKCIDVGAHLHINGFVKSECEHTILEQINILKTTTSRMNGLLPPSAMSFAEEKSVRIDLYTKYFNWVKNGNKHRNFEGFQKKILQELSDILNKFETEDNLISYKISQKKHFDMYFDSLMEIKGDRHTTETDINSFLYVQEKRQMSTDEEYYLISADGKFISWLKEVYTTEKSVADYPSTWLSILLKYAGRERESDYKSFCQFIHLAIPPQVEDLDKKINIKSKIIFSDFSDSIKAMMLEDIKNNYSTYSQYDTDEIIHKAYAKTESQMENYISAIKDKEYKKILEEQEKRHQQELDASRKDLKGYKLASEQRIKDAYSQGRLDEEVKNKKETIDKRVSRIIKRNKIIKATIDICLILLVIITIVALILGIAKDKLPTDCIFVQTLSNNPLWLTVLMLLFEALAGLLRHTLKGCSILTTDEEKIRARIKNKN